MADSQTNKDRLKEITDRIESGIQELFQSDKYAQYLKTMSRFHSYSVNNQVLIHLQKPDATLVAGFNRWKNQFGRNVLKGERGIKIIAPTPYKKKIEQEKCDPDTKLPILDLDGNVIMEEKTIQIPMYRPVTVFDVSQTEGKPLPELASALSGDVANFEAFMEALKRTSPVPISMKPMAESMDGYFSLENQEIAIRPGMSEVQTVSAAIHEMAHALLHNRRKEADYSLDRNTEEVQAESISYAVCAYYGIATGENSFGYIASWSENKTLPELKESLDIINQTAAQLIDGIDENYREILKEREENEVTAVVESPADPAISFQAMNDFGYTGEDMLPLTKERAMELFEQDVPVFLLYGDNTEIMVFEKEEILTHPDFFGITAQDWEQVKDRFPADRNWEDQFLQSQKDAYCIYQLSHESDYLFMNMDYLRDHGITPSHEQYTAVYSGILPDLEADSGLEAIYTKFNIDHPADFRGHSLSVSDIVALKQNDVVSCHYVDSIGFTNVPGFLQNYLKNTEIAVEDDYGMIDGIVNNGGKEKADLSHLFSQAQAVLQEPSPATKKESLLKKLREPNPPHNETSAQKKSAERDLL